MRLIIILFCFGWFACVTQAQEPSKTEDLKEQIQTLLEKKEALNKQMREVDQQLMECFKKVLSQEPQTKNTDKKVVGQIREMREQMHTILIRKGLMELMLRMLEGEQRVACEKKIQEYNTKIKEIQEKSDALVQEHKIVIYKVVVKLDNPVFAKWEEQTLECKCRGNVYPLDLQTFEFLPDSEMDFNFTGKEKGKVFSATGEQWSVDVIITVDGKEIKASLKPSDDGRYHLSYASVEAFIKDRK